MSVVVPDPVTVLPVAIHPQIVQRFAAGRVRATILPAARYRVLRPDDLLSVCEPVTIDARQSRRDRLTIRYDGSHVRVGIPWPSFVAKPAPGRRTADAMPIIASRYTLRVKHVDLTHLARISDEDAVACGVEPSFGGGFCSPLGDPEWFKPYDTGAEALGHLWDAMSPPGLASSNPRVVLVRFEAIARNISSIVPDFGAGAVQWT